MNKITLKQNLTSCRRLRALFLQSSIKLFVLTYLLNVSCHLPSDIVDSPVLHLPVGERKRQEVCVGSRHAIALCATSVALLAACIYLHTSLLHNSLPPKSGFTTMPNPISNHPSFCRKKMIFLNFFALTIKMEFIAMNAETISKFQVPLGELGWQNSDF